MTVLKFAFNTKKAQFKTGEIHIENLEFVGKGEGMEITWDDMDLYLDGKKYEGKGIGTWAIPNVSVDFLFGSILNSYLRDNKGEYTSFEGFEVFNPIKDLTEYNEDGILVKLPVYEYGGVELYELSLQTPSSRYYHHDDSCKLLDNNGEIVTDMECFYESALIDDIVDILKEKVNCLYKSEDIDDRIEDFGGKEGFLAEYDDHSVDNKEPEEEKEQTRVEVTV